MEELNLTEEEIQALQEFDRFLALDEEKVKQLMQSSGENRRDEEEEDEDEDDEEEEEEEEEGGSGTAPGPLKKSLSEYLASRPPAEGDETPARKSSISQKIAAAVKGTAKGEGEKEKKEPKDEKEKEKDIYPKGPGGSSKSKAPGMMTMKATIRAAPPAGWEEAKGHLFETRLFSLASQNVMADLFMVEISEFGLRIRHPHNGLVMRAFPIRSIQRMHFVVNESTSEKLFVLDYTRPDTKEPESTLYGRIAFSSEYQAKIFGKLKETMIALAQSD